MKVYEFGAKDKPIIVLLPGTCCYWKSNFGHVIGGLQNDFYVVCISYDGFDETEDTEFPSMLEETRKIEQYIKINYRGKVCAAYGCSLGGSFVGLLLARHRIQISHAIIGSSDFDQAGLVIAWLKTLFVMPIFYPLLHTGRLHGKLMANWMNKTINEMGPYGTAFLQVLSCNGKPMSFVTKRSVRNQYNSDLVTKLPWYISVKETMVHKVL